MAKPAQIQAIQNNLPKISDSTSDVRSQIKSTITPEIVIALCGPLGTPLHRVSGILKNLLTKMHNYEHVEEIRLSDFIREFGKPKDSASIQCLIDAGNDMRNNSGNSVLVQLAIQKIATARMSKIIKGAESDQSFTTKQDGVVTPSPVVRYCHIIDSIKNVDELNLLRLVYGKLLHVISVYSPLDLRISDLEKKLSDKSEVFKLIDRDSGEEIKNGQSVRRVFPQADFFLRVNDGTDDQIREKLNRYLDLLLGTKIITPTTDERAMYAAHSAARNSACLSRQVGAAITDEAGEVISVGWNDVPRAFGGLYDVFGRPGEANYVDHRCWNKDGGKCFNDEEKTEISTRLTRALINEGIVDASKEKEIENRLRRSSELSGLIEFSRAVHAEMHAILNAGHSGGGRIQGGRLYVTTYPCHSCARHIIAAGITEVRFIEPYRKSLATRLHDDAITESESNRDKVRIVPFDGVSPARFLDLFSESGDGRKVPTTGKMRKHQVTIPVTAATMEAVTTLEAFAVKGLHLPTQGDRS